MDLPTRQSYTMAVVDPNERSAASGVTTIARSVGDAFAPTLTGILMTIPGLINTPFCLRWSEDNLRLAFIPQFPFDQTA